MLCKSLYLNECYSTSDIDECRVGFDNCLDVPITCINTFGTFMCLCPIGFEGDGVIDCNGMPIRRLGDVRCHYCVAFVSWQILMSVM